MAGAIAIEAQPRTIAPIAERSAASKANKEQETGSTSIIILAQKVRKALGKDSTEYQLCFPKGCQTKDEDATSLLSIGNAAYKVLYVNISDIRAKSERRRETRREHMDGFQPMMQIDLLIEILKDLKETNALMKLRNIATTQEDSY